MKDANAFLPEFIEDYNKRFGKIACCPKDAHRPLRTEDDLETIFARKGLRKLSKSLSFQYNGTFYQLETKYPNRIRKTHVEIIERKDRPIEVNIDGVVYEYKK